MPPVERVHGINFNNIVPFGTPEQTKKIYGKLKNLKPSKQKKAFRESELQERDNYEQWRKEIEEASDNYFQEYEQKCWEKEAKHKR